jgi:hypothetical protein
MGPGIQVAAGCSMQVIMKSFDYAVGSTKKIRCKNLNNKALVAAHATRALS